MTVPSGRELVVNFRPTIPSSLWLSFELSCDEDEIDIRAALILRERCEVNGRHHTHNGIDQHQLTIGSVVATLCKWKGHLDLPPAYECLLNRDGTLREGLIDQCELYGNGVDVFVVDHMEIEPGYRGRNLGLAAMRALVRAFATGETLAVTRAMPIVPESQPLPPTELREAQDRLRKYWQRAGFERFSRTEILVRAPGQR